MGVLFVLFVDEETGNYYNYFRDYDPTTGRYLQSDPIGIIGGVNTYGYVSDNPVIYIDPLGLFELYGYQNRGSGRGWQSQFEFKFSPIRKSPNDIAQKVVRNANRLTKAIDFINTEPVGPLHPYNDYLQCAELDSDLEREFANRFSQDRLTKNETLGFLNDMWIKYPDMRELYPSPQNMVNTAEQNSKDHWFYQLRPE